MPPACSLQWSHTPAAFMLLQVTAAQLNVPGEAPRERGRHTSHISTISTVCPAS